MKPLFLKSLIVEMVLNAINTNTVLQLIASWLNVLFNHFYDQFGDEELAEVAAETTLRDLFYKVEQWLNAAHRPAVATA